MTAPILSRITDLPLSEYAVRFLGQAWEAESKVSNLPGQLWEREATRDTSDPLRLDGAQEDSRQTEIDFLRGPLAKTYPYFQSGILRPGQVTWPTK
jgi:hypothetical protein